jgi:hypothetical protein
VAVFARALVHEGAQKLGAYTGETGEATTSQRPGLSHLCPAAHGVSTKRSSGWCSQRRKEAKGGSRPAVSQGALLDDSGNTRGTLKALPLPCARVH